MYLKIIKDNKVPVVCNSFLSLLFLLKKRDNKQEMDSKAKRKGTSPDANEEGGNKKEDEVTNAETPQPKPPKKKKKNRTESKIKNRKENESPRSEKEEEEPAGSITNNDGNNPIKSDTHNSGTKTKNKSTKKYTKEQSGEGKEEVEKGAPGRTAQLRDGRTRGDSNPVRLAPPAPSTRSGKGHSSLSDSSPPEPLDKKEEAKLKKSRWASFSDSKKLMGTLRNKDRGSRIQHPSGGGSVIRVPSGGNVITRSLSRTFSFRQKKKGDTDEDAEAEAAKDEQEKKEKEEKGDKDTKEKPKKTDFTLDAKEKPKEATPAPIPVRKRPLRKAPPPPVVLLDDWDFGKEVTAPSPVPKERISPHNTTTSLAVPDAEEDGCSSSEERESVTGGEETANQGHRRRAKSEMTGRDDKLKPENGVGVDESLVGWLRGRSPTTTASEERDGAGGIPLRGGTVIVKPTIERKTANPRRWSLMRRGTSYESNLPSRMTLQGKIEYISKKEAPTHKPALHLPPSLAAEYKMEMMVKYKKEKRDNEKLLRKMKGEQGETTSADNDQQQDVHGDGVLNEEEDDGESSGGEGHELIYLEEEGAVFVNRSTIDAQRLKSNKKKEETTISPAAEKKEKENGDGSTERTTEQLQQVLQVLTDSQCALATDREMEVEDGQESDSEQLAREKKKRSQEVPNGGVQEKVVTVGSSRRKRRKSGTTNSEGSVGDVSDCGEGDELIFSEQNEAVFVQQQMVK